MIGQVLAVLLLFGAIHALAPSCCLQTTGSCRSACQQISLVTLATDIVEWDHRMMNVHKYCPRGLAVFWQCLNATIQEIQMGRDWVGRSCCDLPQSDTCKMACLQTHSQLDLAQSCRHSDEIQFFNCLERQQAEEDCCNNSNSEECHAACRNIFAARNTPSRQARNAVQSSCSQYSPKVLQCVENLTHTTPAHNPIKSLYCCEQSPDAVCRNTCRTVLHTKTTGVEIIDSLIQGGCGNPLPYDRLWQCFLSNAEPRNTDNIDGVSRIGHMGMDSAKLHCCFKAKTDSCRQLCFKTYSTDWSYWRNFDKICYNNPQEIPLQYCISEVEDPCDLGCNGLSHCTNFNNRPTELFRSCNSRADAAAENDLNTWRNGVIKMPFMDIPVLDITKCLPEMWKAIACLLQIKPCHARYQTHHICKSDCIEVLSRCVDHSRLSIDQTPESLCDALSPQTDDIPCLSIKQYIVESPYKDGVHQVTYPCKPNPCGSSEVCVVNRDCRPGYGCAPYLCKPGCKMGELSQFVVPQASYVRIPLTNSEVGCYKVCRCSESSHLEDCASKFCSLHTGCWVEGTMKAHGSQYWNDCNICICFLGDVICSKRQCIYDFFTNDDRRIYTGLPCNCLAHYVPVCGDNGRTYPSSCLATCAGLTEAQFSFGSCALKDPCSKNVCPGKKCIAKKQVCLTSLHISCQQYECVETTMDCNKISRVYEPVCDTDNQEHPNLCWLLKRRKILAYRGACQQSCRRSGAVCGHNSETYPNECTAWADRVAVDYFAKCTAVGQITESHQSANCAGVTCPPLPTDGCSGIIPPGACCQVCAGVIKILYSSNQANQVINKIGTISIRTIAEKLRLHVKVAECDVFGYLSLESDIIVLVMPITNSPTLLQYQACVKEAEKIEALIRQGSHSILAELALSPLATATVIYTERSAAYSSSVSNLHLNILLTVFMALLPVL